MQNYDAIIIGAGACGLMCAVQAGFLGKKVLVLEKNEKSGAKILISGGGRCNYTNLYTEPLNFISGNEHFCKSALSQWTVADTLQFFERYGIEGHEKTLGQLFPVSNNARDIVNVFLDLCREMEQEILNEAEVSSVSKEREEYVIQYKHQGKIQKIRTASVVVTTGGLPIPRMGATDFALQLAKQFGLKLTRTAAALVPLVIAHSDRPWYEQLSGTSVYCRVSKDHISFDENILFTHWGLSGPAILQISSYWKQGESFEIDFLPQFNLPEMIVKDRDINGKKIFGNYLGIYLPKRLVDALSDYLPADKNLATLSNSDLQLIDSYIHHFEVTPAGDKGYDKAEVMLGGISTDELSSKTLEAKKVKGLYFGGECVDVTGWLGGYNFQWAWASGYVIAQSI